MRGRAEVPVAALPFLTYPYLCSPSLKHANFGWYLCVPHVAAAAPGQGSLSQGVHGLATGCNEIRGNISSNGVLASSIFVETASCRLRFIWCFKNKS